MLLCLSQGSGQPTISHYVFHDEPEHLGVLRAALEQAHNEIRQKPTTVKTRSMGFARRLNAPFA
jgi:hypothetical protein